MLHDVDKAARPAISFESAPGQHVIRDIERVIAVHGPDELHMEPGPAEGTISLKPIDADTTDEPKHEPGADAE